MQFFFGGGEGGVLRKGALQKYGCLVLVITLKMISPDFSVFLLDKTRLQRGRLMGFLAFFGTQHDTAESFGHRDSFRNSGETAGWAGLATTLEVK